MRRKNYIYFFRRAFVAMLILAVAQFVPSLSHARDKGGLSILRDAEIESTLRLLSEPIFIAAGLDPNSVRTFLVRDKTLNAFVAGGQNVFLHTGLLLAADNVDEVIGVIAHETGHISGSHLARYEEGLKGATAYSVLGVLLGAAAIAAGSGDAGMAVMMGSQEAARRSVLSYSRIQESAADQAAITFLDKAQQSSKGLVSFLDQLGEQELLITKNRDPYVRSHPVTSERISRLHDNVNKSPYANAPSRPEYVEAFKRMQAKLFGYLKPPEVTLQKYPESDQSLYAYYARTFAYYRQHDVKSALREIDTLITRYPHDPYFYDTKGQILFENGFLDDAVRAYEEAVRYEPDQAMFRISLAQAMLSLEQPILNGPAVKHLQFAVSREPYNSFAWRQLSIAYNRAGNEAMQRLSTAEEFLLTGKLEPAIVNAKKAQESFEKNTPAWVRAQDIQMTVESLMLQRGQKTKPKKDSSATQEHQHGYVSAYHEKYQELNTIWAMH